MQKSLPIVVSFALISVVHSVGRASSDGHGPRIVGITICSQDGAGLSPNPGCPDGTVDTQQVVRGIGLEAVNEDGVKSATDEHSSVFPPGYLGDNDNYLFFVASGYDATNRDIGMMVLSSPGPDANGQWALTLADGYGDYGANGRGTVFLSPTSQGWCPDTGGDATKQDQTFDLAYAAPGSLFRDPTSRIRRLLMIYEGTNACIGNPGGRKLDTGAYEAVGVATSVDGGRSWPRYRSNNAPFIAVDLPSANQTQGPKEAAGAMGAAVCIGNDCTSPAPSTYGRYEVLTPPVPLDDALMSNPENLKNGLGQNVANAEPSAFLDDVPSGRSAGNPHADDSTYLYAVYVYVPGLLRVSPAPYQLPQGRNKDVMVARARLDATGKPLRFFKWNGSSFNDPGVGGLGAGVLQTADTSFQHCADPSQERSQASISYVEKTQQYLLTFVCNSPGPPQAGLIDPDPTKKGSAWFFATTGDLSSQSWSTPAEVTGSWATWTHHDVLPAEERCPVFNGYYPTFMSPGHAPGHLSTQGYVFYLWGSLGACQSDQLPKGDELPDRKYTSRQFRIITGKP